MNEPSGAGGWWGRVALGPGVTLIRSDAQGVAAFNKPAGVLSHPNRPADERRSLIRAGYVMDGEFYFWEGEGGRQSRVWLLNRLDAATSGVILAAADANLAAEVRGRFKGREVKKVYRALVFGRPAKPSEVWRDRLSIDKSGGRIRAGLAKGAGVGGATPLGGGLGGKRTGGGFDPSAILAETGMRLLQHKASAGVALLELVPHTGRSHQLRVQCARRGLPIVGDQTYGDFARNRQFARAAGTKRLFLHSLSVRLTYAFGGREHAFEAEAPLPAEFTAST